MGFGILGFVTFVFVKAATGIQFEHPVSLVYAALYAILTVVVVMGVNLYSLQRIRMHVLKQIEKNGEITSDDVMIFALPWAVATAALVALGFLTVSGFSTSFSDRVLSLWSSYRPQTSNQWEFGVILAVPPSTYYLVAALRVIRSVKSERY